MPSSQKGTAHLLLVVAAVGLIAFLVISNTVSFKEKTFQSLFSKPSSYAAGTTTYYVDCSRGSDSNDGKTQTTAWKSLTQASNFTFMPGDTLLLKKGCVFTGDQLKLTESGTSSAPITISNYGSGALPIIQNAANPPVFYSNVLLTDGASYITIDGIYAKGVSWKWDSACSNQAYGGEVHGFRFYSGHDNILKNSKAIGNSHGVLIDQGSSNLKILNNTITNNNIMNILTPKSVSSSDDAGAFGVVIKGDSNIIAKNTISGSFGCSYDFKVDSNNLGSDGSIFELYGGIGNNIHHNITSNSDVFTELGDSRTSNNTFAYNLFTTSTPKANFLFMHGPKGGWGSPQGTKFYNNTIYTSASDSATISCTEGCSNSVLTFKNNIIWGNGTVVVIDAPFNETNNLYWNTSGTPLFTSFTPSSTSKIANPLFTSVGSNYHLKSKSPAIDAGISESVTAGYDKDLDNKTVPLGSGVDMGAYETNP